MTPCIDVNPELLRWACEHGQVNPEKLRKRFPTYDDWESGEKVPTLRQMKAFANFTHAPIGSLFLSKPMEDRLPIQDLWTMGEHKISKPSANLLGTVYLCQRRQNWYQENARFVLDPVE